MISETKSDEMNYIITR